MTDESIPAEGDVEPIIPPPQSVAEASQESRGWGVSTVVERVHSLIDEMRFELPTEPQDFHHMTDDQLREQLAKWGARQGYLEIQIAYVESHRLAINRIMDAAIHTRMATLERESEKRLLKDSMVATIISADPRLQVLRRQSIEVDAEYTALLRIREGFDVFWRTCSRLLSSRQAEIGKL